MSMIYGKGRENRDATKVRINSWFLAVHNVIRVGVILITTIPDVSYKSQINTTTDL